MSKMCVDRIKSVSVQLEAEMPSSMADIMIIRSQTRNWRAGHLIETTAPVSVGVCFLLAGNRDEVIFGRLSKLGLSAVDT